MRTRVTSCRKGGDIRDSIGFMQLRAETEEEREFLTDLHRELMKCRELPAISAVVEMRRALAKISRRRPVTDDAGAAFYRSRQDARDVLAKPKGPRT